MAEEYTLQMRKRDQRIVDAVEKGDLIISSPSYCPDEKFQFLFSIGIKLPRDCSAEKIDRVLTRQYYAALARQKRYTNRRGEQLELSFD